MYEAITYDVILQRMLDRVSEAMDKREGSVIWDTHSPTAIELQLLYLELDRILTEGYADTASRDYLILRAAERGMSPYAASHAVLKGVFTPSTVDVIGQRFNLEGLNYVVLDQISTGTYRVQCETAGTVGNRYLGTITPIDYIDGLETATLTELLIPGEDEETTEEFRARYLSSLNPVVFGGNHADYIQKVKAIDGVGGVKVERRWAVNGSRILASQIIPNAVVQAWYNTVNISSLPTDVKNWLRTVYTATLQGAVEIGGTVLVTISNGDDYGAATTGSGGLVESVQETIDPLNSQGRGYGLAPIGHVVTVQSVTEVPIDVVVYIWTDRTLESIQPEAESLVNQYFLDLRQKWENDHHLSIHSTRILALFMNIDGVEDVQAITYNGNETPPYIDEYEVPVLNSLTLDTMATLDV